MFYSHCRCCSWLCGKICKTMLMLQAICLRSYLVGKVIGVKNYFNIACFANKRLWLLRFTTKHPRLSTVWDICFWVSINDLKKIKEKARKWDRSNRYIYIFHIQIIYYLFNDTKLLHYTLWIINVISIMLFRAKTLQMGRWWGQIKYFFLQWVFIMWYWVDLVLK